MSLFRAIGAIARNLTTANALGCMGMLLMVMLGGYVLTKQYVHPWCALATPANRAPLIMQMLIRQWQIPCSFLA